MPAELTFSSAASSPPVLLAPLLPLSVSLPLARTLATQTGMTNQWLADQGLFSIRDLWMKAHGYA